MLPQRCQVSVSVYFHPCKCPCELLSSQTRPFCRGGSNPVELRSLRTGEATTCERFTSCANKSWVCEPRLPVTWNISLTIVGLFKPWSKSGTNHKTLVIVVMFSRIWLAGGRVLPEVQKPLRSIHVLMQHTNNTHLLIWNQIENGVMLSLNTDWPLSI